MGEGPLSSPPRPPVPTPLHVNEWMIDGVTPVSAVDDDYDDYDDNDDNVLRCMCE